MVWGDVGPEFAAEWRDFALGRRASVATFDRGIPMTSFERLTVEGVPTAGADVVAPFSVVVYHREDALAAEAIRVFPAGPASAALREEMLRHIPGIALAMAEVLTATETMTEPEA